MTPGQIHVRQWRVADRAEEQISERAAYLVKADAEFKENCEIVEYQIGTYIKIYVRDEVIRPLWIIAAAAAAYYLAPDQWKWLSSLAVWAVAAAALPLIKRREKRSDSDRIIKRRERCKEPTAKDREADLFFGGEERMKDADKKRDWFRRHLIIDEMRFLDRYGYLPDQPHVRVQDTPPKPQAPESAARHQIVPGISKAAEIKGYLIVLGGLVALLIALFAINGSNFPR